MTRLPSAEKPTEIGLRRSGNAGFLLVEVLATMTISAFLLAALVSVVALMLRASDRVGHISQEIESTSRVMASLTREIEQIAPLHWAGQGAGFVFKGTDRSLVFARQSVLPDGAVDSQAIFLLGDGRLLFRKQAPLTPGDREMADLVPGNAQQLLPANFVVRFAYFARLDTGLEALTDSWKNPAQLPVAVRISLSDSAGVVRSSTRVQIRVDAEPGCAAPGRGLCSFVAKAATDEEDPTDVAKPIDPDDASGWLRYAK